jgi:hypothetical protein
LQRWAKVTVVAMPAPGLLGERAPEARPLNLPGLVAAHPAELLEDGFLILRGDPDAGVADRNLDRPVGEGSLHPDPAPFRGELHRVGQEIQQDLLDLALIAHEFAQLRVHVDVEGRDAKLGAAEVNPL